MGRHEETFKALMEIKTKLDRLEGEKQAIEKSLTEQEKKLSTATFYAGECDQALHLLELVGNASRTQIKDQIENLVGHALKLTFEREDYGFVIDFVNRRNQIECDLLFSVGDRKSNPLEDGGGGVDVITTALRFILISLTHQPGPIILDEPGKWVSSEHRMNFLSFLKEFSHSADRQIIMTTHIQEYTDPNCNIIQVALDAGNSVVSNG